MTDNQTAVVNYRLRSGYKAYKCKYLGIKNCVYATKGKHNMVINDNGYDIFRPGYYPTNLEEIRLSNNT